MGRSVSLQLFLAVFLVSGLLGGCGSSKKEGEQQTQVSAPTKVGSESCTNTCHSTTRDITGNIIAQTWANTTHTTVQGVQCEDCHGGGSMHWGVGPMPFPIPQAEQCSQASCHASFLSGFNQTAHANTHAEGAPFGPDKFFFQGDPGSGQASLRTRNGADIQEVTPTGQPVNKSQHIVECSVCHNPNQRFVAYSTNLFRPAQRVFTSSDSQDQDGESNFFQSRYINPAVSCAGCHDAHQPQQMVKIPQRSNQVGYPIYRRYSTPELGRIQGTVFQPNGVVLTGVPVAGAATNNNEVSPELLCAACHTVSKYKFSNLSTHQDNVYPQWTHSGHGEREKPAWAEFSANPAGYINPLTGLAYTDLGHATSYPVDMALRSYGATASATSNQGNNNFACFKCHNGLTSIAYQKNIQGTPAAPVVFGDASATCITCHDPHQKGTFAGGANTTSNIRVPVAMTNYSTVNVKVFGNVFLDNQPIPQNNANETICIFCHQGRESGFTLYRAKLAPGKSAAGSFFNPHYLGTAAMLWGANGYEFSGKSYSANVAHQQANCASCHMDNATEDNTIGGHSWNPNVASCNTSSCHGGGVGPAVAAKPGTAAPEVNAYRAAFDTSDYDGSGALEPIAVEIKGLQDKLIALLAANGIFYTDLKYPYFFADPAFTTNYTAWNTATGGTTAFKAAFNLQFIIKGLPSAATSQTAVPNASAAVHNYKYIIQLLRDSYEEYNAVAAAKGATLSGVRPAGTRPATVYGPGQ
ncbi:cytochrome c, 11 heme-binding sites [Geotalea daltonii FRC-32]|uniref:Cytochrome c, 11 heme-binding sites n=1 Tax=Geotalea daltonii (strain DSM 22248 / JCM 15807 / FRC-32) TaxID=316067 RepID=B9M6I4_GEODF|nr:hypothetical protein [Geotalea daltonii]ACM20044.1 cytochrome c, 11 heme-binding sites [Geotalea daltonii FRC-32]